MNSITGQSVARLRKLAAFAFFVFCLAGGEARAATTRTQLIELKQGWNAVWLEVSPVNDAVTQVFDPEAVDMVARYFTPEGQVRFIENPGEQPWNTAAWGVWYAPTKAESFLTNLHAIQGNCAYLVHATKSFILSVTGEVHYRRLNWNTESYNLVGLPVSGAVKPTFARFFSGAGGRVGSQVYRLVEGSWQKIGNLATTEVKPGEAYWIYADGKTNYQGPLELQFPGGDGIGFGSGVNLNTVQLTNRSSASFSVTAAVEPGGNLPLFRTVLNLSEFTEESRSLAGGASLGNLAAGDVSQLGVEFRPGILGGSSGSAVLTLTTSDGITLRLPVRATLP